jgi:hypothetical protein
MNEEVWSLSEMILMAKPKYPEEKLLQSTFSTTDPTWMSWD